MKGFKGYNKGLICRNFQYEENKEFSMKESPELCEKGFHFCEVPLDVFKYYPPKIGAEYTEVESNGVTKTEDNKSATNKLKILSKISIAKLFKIHFELLIDKIKADPKTANTAGNYSHANTAGNESHANTAGDCSHANTAGDYSHANTAGDCSHANTAGYYSHANTAGNYSHANTAGNESHANTAGDYSHANTAGYYSHANTAGNYSHANTAGDYSHANTAGNESIASSLGINSKASVKHGWIVIVDWRYNDKWIIKNIYHAKVGQQILDTTIEPETAYWFDGGILKSEKI